MGWKAYMKQTPVLNGGIALTRQNLADIAYAMVNYEGVQIGDHVLHGQMFNDKRARHAGMRLAFESNKGTLNMQVGDFLKAVVTSQYLRRGNICEEWEIRGQLQRLFVENRFLPAETLGGISSAKIGGSGGECIPDFEAEVMKVPPSRYKNSP